MSSQQPEPRADTEFDELGALLPEPSELEQMPVRDHVAIFEQLHAELARRLDDAPASGTQEQ